MKSRGVRTTSFDAATIARDLGDLRLGNTVMLGAIADQLPFSAEVLLDCIVKRFARKGEKVVEANRKAFAAGRAAAKAAAPAHA
jgi:Pyruvate ferredoxin/flavodoxin oxidoreductase.